MNKDTPYKEVYKIASKRMRDLKEMLGVSPVVDLIRINKED